MLTLEVIYLSFKIGMNKLKNIHIMKFSSKNESTKVTYFNMDKFQKQGWPKV